MPEKSNFWDNIASQYDSQAEAKYAKAYAATIEKSSQYLEEADNLLDLACGTGITTMALAPKVKTVDAIDISAVMLKQAEDKAKAKDILNIRFTKASLEDWAEKERIYDGVMAFNILHFLQDPQAALKILYNMLNQDGILLSATDCLAEKRSLLGFIPKLLAKTGVIPKLHHLKVDQLKKMIENTGFKIIEEADLFPQGPPNYFIAAKKE